MTAECATFIKGDLDGGDDDDDLHGGDKDDDLDGGVGDLDGGDDDDEGQTIWCC